MAIIKRNLKSILGSFNKTMAELDAFGAEQDKRRETARNNMQRLAQLEATQHDIVADANKQIAQALAVRNKIAALIE